MKLSTLTSKPDIEFRVAENTEDLVEWALTESNRRFVFPAFLERPVIRLHLRANEVSITSNFKQYILLNVFILVCYVP